MILILQYHFDAPCHDLSFRLHEGTPPNHYPTDIATSLFAMQDTKIYIQYILDVKRLLKACLKMYITLRFNSI
jgi:hypothetical protein